MSLYIQRPSTYEALQWSTFGDSPNVTVLTTEQRAQAVAAGLDPDTTGRYEFSGGAWCFVVPTDYILNDGEANAAVLSAAAFTANYVANPY